MVRLPPALGLTAAQTLLAVAVARSLDLKIKATWPYAFEVSSFPDLKVIGDQKHFPDFIIHFVSPWEFDFEDATNIPTVLNYFSILKMSSHNDP